MRLLLTTDTVGGVWTYAVDLARALEPHRVLIALATMGAPLSDSQKSQIHALPHVTVYESAYRLEWMEDPWDDVRQSGDWLRKIESDFNPDVVHLNGYAHGACGFSAPVLVVGHSCVLSWWEACRGERAPASWNQYRQAVTAGLRSADLVVAPSRAMLDSLQRHYGPLSAARVIPNGRVAAAHASLPDAKPVAPRTIPSFSLPRYSGGGLGRGPGSASFNTAPSLALPRSTGGGDHQESIASEIPLTRSFDSTATHKHHFIFSAGRIWDEAKNIAALDAIASETSWPIFVAGNNCHPSGETSAINGAHLLGLLDEATMSRWYAEAAIYALPARYESFGLSILEAAMAGCALVIGDIPSLRETWDDAAEFVAPDDTAGLASKLNLLIEDRSHREELSRKAFERSRAFSAERFAARYHAAYEQLIANALHQSTSRTPIPCAS